jgi:hypothetical protein
MHAGKGFQPPLDLGHGVMATELSWRVRIDMRGNEVLGAYTIFHCGLSLTQNTKLTRSQKHDEHDVSTLAV